MIVIKRIYFLFLCVFYIIQGITLIAIPIALLCWVFNISDDYISDYVEYTKKQLQ